MRNRLYLLSLVPSLLAIFGNLTGGIWAFTNYFFSFFLLALIEWFTGSNASNKTNQNSNLLPELILYLHVLANILVLSSLAYGIYTEILSGWYVVLAAFSSGAHTATSAVVIAHELIHKKSKMHQQMGKFLLALAGNTYFYIHHLRIHHKDVGTAKDAATARYNESLYRFVVRSISGQIKQAWYSEISLLSRKEKSAYSLNNYIIRAALIQVGIGTAVFVVLSWWGLLAWLINVFLAALLLEYVNYIEHYGLERGEKDRVSAIHSWNCNKYVSRFILIDLSRHADHHYYANKPYHTLDSHEESPVLPGGYAALIIPAMIPALWRKLVNPRLTHWKKIHELQG